MVGIILDEYTHPNQIGVSNKPIREVVYPFDPKNFSHIYNAPCIDSFYCGY